MKELCSANGWSCLRIDGSVPKDRRYKILDFFNKPVPSPPPSNTTTMTTVPINKIVNPFFILLLSGKVGGIGINIIGANHLMLMENDWNPSNDAQIIGRIWRQGQRKRTFIYRLGYQSTIEEFITFQQHEKVNR
jgi:SNF2 family DNA or RNA helicase